MTFTWQTINFLCCSQKDDNHSSWQDNDRALGEWRLHQFPICLLCVSFFFYSFPPSATSLLVSVLISLLCLPQQTQWGIWHAWALFMHQDITLFYFPGQQQFYHICSPKRHIPASFLHCWVYWFIYLHYTGLVSLTLLSKVTYNKCIFKI